MTVVIREAGLSDAQALAMLRWEWDTSESPVAASREEFVADFEAWLADHARTHFPFLAESGDRAVGMAWLVLQARVPTPDNFHRIGADLQSVYVTPDMRGQGLGVGLVQAVIAAARSHPVRHLTVRTGHRATPFYPRFGFAINEHSLEISKFSD